jgi:hypothetical protein
MKLGFAFLLLTCALLFPQGPPTQGQLTAKCIADCNGTCATASAKCLKTAKTDADKKHCQTTQEQCVSTCDAHCKH